MSLREQPIMDFEAVRKHLHQRVRVELHHGSVLMGLLERSRLPLAAFVIHQTEFTADAVRTIAALDESMFLAELEALLELPAGERLRAREALVTRIVSELGRGQMQAEVWVEEELRRQKVPTLETTCLEHLLRFVGYGVDAPRFIFLGAEEALTGSAWVNLDARCRGFKFPLHDKDDALEQLAAAYEEHGALGDAEEYRAAHTPGHVPTWKLCSMLVAALRSGGTCTPDGDWRLRWEAEYRKLGRRVAGADTLLAELFPLPKPGLDQWPPAYVALFGFTTAARYFSGLWPRRPAQSVVPSRRQLICDTIQKGPTTYLIQYSRGSGGEFWERLDGILDLVDSLGPSGGRGRWHVVNPNRIEVALARSGIKVARLGFPWGQAAGTRVTDVHVSEIVNALHGLRR